MKTPVQFGILIKAKHFHGEFVTAIRKSKSAASKLAHKRHGRVIVLRKGDF